MRTRVVTLVMVFILALVPLAQVADPAWDGPVTGSGDEGTQGQTRGPSFLGDTNPWTDTLDDMDKVYVPPGGLMGVEVVGGEVRLESGATQGWVASSEIPCPVGLRYDLVLLEAEVPGNSSVEVSVLDPSSPPTSGDHANATVPGLVDITQTDVSLTRLDPEVYPRIRIQVRLVANGTDRPRLLAWSVHFGDPGEWREDFLGTGKMKDSSGFDVTDGMAEVDFSKTRSGIGGYGPYPPIMLTVRGDIQVYGPNQARNGYKYVTTLKATYVKSVMFEDLNLDGLLDMVVVQGYDNANPGFRESELWWGDAEGSWTKSGKLKFIASGFRRCATGDFNNDGWPDLVFVCYDSGGPNGNKHHVFLNKGDGKFNYQSDVALSPPNAPYCWGVDAGDLNNDGYDDVVLCKDNVGSTFFGGQGGPDATRDIHFDDIGYLSYRILIRDVNNDGYQDVITAGKVGVYLGGDNGPDNIADFRTGSANVYDVQVGDINNDGYTDLIEYTGFSIFIWEGDSKGWSAANAYSVNLLANDMFLRVIDVDLDGYDDIITGHNNSLNVFYGGKEHITSTPDESIAMPVGGMAWDIVPAVRYRMEPGHTATFTTETIKKPDDKRWDILDLDGIMPENSSVRITLLDGQGRPLPDFRDLPDMSIDLSSLTDRNDIRVRVMVVCKSNDTTPTLDRLLVNWMDKWEWREEFYGAAKAAALNGLDMRNDELQRAQDISGLENGSYLSKAFGPEIIREAGSFDTFRYTARLGMSQSGKVRLVDNVTSVVLVEAPLTSGTHELDLTDAFSLKDHPFIQVNFTVEGLDMAAEFALDDIWINWTTRVNLPPTVVDIWPSMPTVHRTHRLELLVNVTDSYDDGRWMPVVVEHQVQGSTEWEDHLFDRSVPRMYRDGLLVLTITPGVNAPLGVYRFRANVTDLDGEPSALFQSSHELRVLANLPSAPRYLHATAGDTQVELEWRPPADEGDRFLTGYRVLRGLTLDTLTPRNTTSPFDTRYTDTDVENGVTYLYAVLAYSELGNGTLSAVVNATPLGLPSAPLNLRALASDGQVTLTWDPPDDKGGSPIVGYYVHRGMSTTDVPYWDETEGTTYTDTGLLNGQTVYYAVCAVSAVGEGAQCAAVPATPLALPDPPGGLLVETAIGKEDGGSSVTYYRLYRGEDKGDLELIAVVGPTTFSYNDEDAVGGIEYVYAVSAVTEAGEGGMTDPVPAMAIGPPGAPVGLVATAGKGEVTLTWSAPLSDGGSSLIGYIILRGDSETTLIEVASIGPATTYTDDGAESGQTYFYAVAALNDAGTGATSGVVPATPEAVLLPPGKVLSLTGEAKGTRVTLLWTTPDDDGGSPITGYVVLRGTSPGNMTVVATFGVVTMFTDEGLERGVTYYYSVCAVNEVGQGEPFAAFEVKVEKEKDDSPGLGAKMALAALGLAMFAGVGWRSKRRPRA